MNYTTALHIHFTLIICFLIFFAFKAVLLFTNKKELLGKIRDKTKIIDILLGVGVLASGLFLAINFIGFKQGWIHVKLTLLLIAIPLGIVGMRKEKKMLVLIALLILVYMYFIGDQRSLTPWKASIPANQSKVITKNATITAQSNCASFHGFSIFGNQCPVPYQKKEKKLNPSTIELLSAYSLKQ